MSSKTALIDAVENSDLLTVNSLIQSGTCNVNVMNICGDTPLHIAIRKRNIQIVRCLSEEDNCNVNLQNIGGNTPLQFAVSYDDLKTVKCLLEHTSCDVNIQNHGGYTPLHTAVQDSDIQIIRSILDHITCDVNIQDSKGNTPLHTAVCRNDKEIVRCLLDRPICNVNIQNSVRETPLHRAVQRNDTEIVMCLINRTGCSVHIKNQDGNSPFSTVDGLETLHTMAKCQNVEFVRVLIQHNVDVLTNHVDNQLQLVQFILSKNDCASLWFFIQNGLYINSLTSSGENIVHLIAKFFMDYLESGDFKFLFNHGLDFNLIDTDGNSPLMVASLLNNLPFIQFLSDLSCDIYPVNRQNHQGHTALHLCVIGFTLIKEKLNKMKSNKVVKELCDCEYYPKYLACINTLLNPGTDVNKQDKGGKTVLMLACMKNDRTLLKRLLDSGADVNIVDIHGRSALQYIDLTNNVYDLTCFNLLLSHGCQSFNQPWLNGNTIIQNVLKFSPLWQIDDTVNFIKFLISKNVNLQHLTSDVGDNFYDQLSLEEFSSESRHELRQILYLSGGSFEQITKILHFEVEESYEATLPESLRENPREKFNLFTNNLSLQKTVSERFSPPEQLESFVDDDYDNDYDSYDLNKENDDYENDYLVYKDCNYLNKVPEDLKQFKTSELNEAAIKLSDMALRW